ncbi:MAG: hypothetical protein M2R45_04677 [Verrucomicrobia subdivision 3 bacterium]|nr:hypothetical protein [Limisphaerales bacterium]MCS1416600.1 hypothetical protein [Limisphaerales bacterium]
MRGAVTSSGVKLQRFWQIGLQELAQQLTIIVVEIKSVMHTNAKPPL